MDVDCQQQAPRTQLQAAWSVAHQCSHVCSVQHAFGNTFVCASSGMMHVCDATCNHRVWADRYSDICVLSRRVFPRPEAAAPEPRKRNAGQEAQRAKRVCSAYCAQQELLPGFAPEDQMVA